MESHIVLGWLGVIFFVFFLAEMISDNTAPREPAKSVLCGVLAVICLVGGIVCFANAYSMRITAEQNNQTAHE